MKSAMRNSTILKVFTPYVVEETEAPRVLRHEGCKLLRIAVHEGGISGPLRDRGQLASAIYEGMEDFLRGVLKRDNAAFVLVARTASGGLSRSSQKRRMSSLL